MSLLYAQMALPLSLPDTPSLDNFVSERNDEVLSHLSDIVHDRFAHTCLYLWGDSGSGKSHLLYSLANMGGSYYVAAHRFDDGWPDAQLYLVDDVDQLDHEQQVWLFHLYNFARQHDRKLILTAKQAPQDLLGYLPDLKTRMAWDLVYKLELLTDDDKVAVLNRQAQERGLKLASDVVPYMLTHMSRDLSALHMILLKLDEYSLQTQKPVTLPLLKNWLKTQDD